MAGPHVKRSPLRRASYRTLRSDEPDPEGDPLIYNATDGCVMQRWKIAPSRYVERPLRDENRNRVRHRPFTAKRIDRADARRRYEAGSSLPVIAAALGCTSGQLSRLLRAEGVVMRGPSAYATPLDPAEVVARFRDGEGFTAIGRSLGVSTRRVKRELVAQGEPLRRPGRVKGLGPGGGPVGYQTEFQAARPLVRARSGGRCEAAASPNCSGRGTDVHHRRLRSQGGTNDLANLLDVCRWCHSFIHHNPAASYEQGWMLRSSAEPDG